MSYCERHKNQYEPGSNVCVGCHAEAVNAARSEGEQVALHVEYQPKRDVLRLNRKIDEPPPAR